MTQRPRQSQTGAASTWAPMLAPLSRAIAVRSTTPSHLPTGCICSPGATRVVVRLVTTGRTAHGCSALKPTAKGRSPKTRTHVSRLAERRPSYAQADTALARHGARAHGLFARFDAVLRYGRFRLWRDQNVANQSPPRPSFEFTQRRGGWAAGGGIETPLRLFGLLGPNWTSKTEYLLSTLGERRMW